MKVYVHEPENRQIYNANFERIFGKKQRKRHVMNKKQKGFKEKACNKHQRFLTEID